MSEGWWGYRSDWDMKHLRPRGKGWGSLRDWSLALLLIVGFTFGVSGNVSAAHGKCFDISTWPAYANQLGPYGEAPFIWLGSKYGYITVTLNTKNKTWTVVEFKRAGPNSGISMFCPRASTVADNSGTDYGVGEWPAELKALAPLVPKDMGDPT